MLRGFDPHGAPGLAGCWLWVGYTCRGISALPTVPCSVTDVAGFAASYGMGVASPGGRPGPGRAICTRADCTLAPSTAAIEDLAAHRIPRVHHWARGVDITGFAPSARDNALRRHWSPAGRPIVGSSGAGPREARRRLAVLARRDDVRW